MESTKRSAAELAVPQVYGLDDNAVGVINKEGNLVFMTVVSRDDNNLKAEYRAGFIQGKLQGRTIITARDNSWDNAYLTDAAYSFPKQPGTNQRGIAYRFIHS